MSAPGEPDRRTLMEFTSDNAYGVSPEMLAAIAEAASGPAASYGADPITGGLAQKFASVFEHEVAVYPLISGTAANALALSTITPPHGAIICHELSHISVDECGAPEFFTHGAKLVALAGSGGKISERDVGAALLRYRKGDVHQVQPMTISISQSTEFGTIYKPDEIRAISGVARRNNMKLHMDGARLGNAVAGLACSPADITWRVGVDVLSFGATKNGALGAEAVLFFAPEDVADFEFRRKKAGHLISKMRFVSAQLEAYLAEGRWLKHAGHANRLARALADGLTGVPGAEIAYPVEANEVLVRLPDPMIARLRAAGARFYDWSPSSNGRTLIRLVTSFASSEDSVQRFLSLARK
jgi:threonine aldolase